MLRFFLALCLLPVMGLAQEPTLWHIREAEDIPGDRLFDLFQDRDGFLWLGTDVGLLRFDGTNFQHYSHPNQTSSTLTRLQQDAAGRLWMHNFSGQIFYLEQDSLYEFLPWKEYPENRPFEAMVMDQEGRMWLVGKEVREPIYYEFETDSWGEVVMSDSSVKFNWMIQDSLGRFFLSSNKGIWLMHEGLFDRIALANFDKDQPFNISLTSEGMFAFDREREVPGIFPLDQDGATKLTIPNEEEIFGLGVNSIKGTDDRYQWICTRSGLYGFDRNFAPLFQGKRLLDGKLISDFLRDREGNYWIATLRSGLHMIPNLQVKHYNQDNSRLPDNRITALAQGPGHDLLLGFQNGEGAVFSPVGKEMTVFRGPLNREVPTILYDAFNEHIWLSSGSYLCSFDLQGNMLVKRRNSATKYMTLFGNNLLRAYPQGADAIRLVPTFGEDPPLSPAYFARYPSSDDRGYLSLELSQDRSWAILADSLTNHIWVGGETDLLLVTPAGSETIRLGTKGGKERAILAKDLAQSESGMIWVGTQSQGVIGLEGREVKYHFSTQNLLPTNQCRAIETDGEVLWIGSDQGIIRLVPANEEIHLFNSKHGLPTNNIRDLHLAGDTLYAATPKGLIEMPKQVVMEPIQAPPIFMTGLALWEKDTSLEAGAVLPYDQNNLRFEYLGLAYRTRNEFSYQYRLLGLDSNWVEVPASQRIARFPSLPPGDYTFEVVADQGGGVVSTSPARFPFSIALPFWMRWWFWLLCATAIGTILALIFQARIRNLESRNYIQQQLRSAQLAALKSQMNPHFIFNALNSIQDFILLNEKRQANAYLGKFADLMRLYLNMSNQRGIILADEIRAMRLYLDLEGIRFGEKFQYHIEVHDSVDPEAIEIPAMVIQPYIENAIKHGLLHKKGDRLLTVFFEVVESQDVLYCEIRDNGVGRKRSQEIQLRNPIKRKSFATDATERRLNLLNYGRKTSIGADILDLYDANEEACGTQVNIRIPLESLPNFSD